jgi:probable phosphoglycerate mutase
MSEQPRVGGSDAGLPGSVGGLARAVMELEHCLLLVRHGQSEWNVQDRMATRTDTPLTPCGEAQARALATSLRGVSFSSAASSPSSRALVTAQLGLAYAEGATPIMVDERLLEIDAGPFEGHTYEDLQALETPLGLQYAAYAREHDPIYPPGAEQHDRTCVRVGSLLAEIAAKPGRHLAVSHGGFIRQLVCVFLGHSPCYYRRLKLENCHGVLLRFYPQPPHQLVGHNLPPAEA